MTWHKYNAKRTVIDGHSFPSRLEADTYAYLKLLESAKEIKDIRQQVRTELSKANIACKIDFSFTDVKTGETVYAEAKGVETERWQIIKKLWRAYGLGRLQIYKAGNRGNVYLAEEIVPEGV